VYDGMHGWVSDPAGVRDVPDAGLREMEAGLKRDIVSALLAAESGELKVRLLPDVKDADGRLQHAMELSQATLNPFVLYVDPETNLISKEVFVADDPGLPIVEVSFSDYRPVNGVMVAYQDAVKTGGRQVLTRRITDIQFNVPIDPALFKRPSS